MRTSCLIVDDEPLAIKVIASYLENLPTFDVVATCSSAVEAFETLHSRPVDLVFLDIEMPGLSGLELIRSLKPAPAIILVTAHREYAAESYDLDVLDYLVKPVSLPRFLRAINRFQQHTGAQPSTGVSIGEFDRGRHGGASRDESADSRIFGRKKNGGDPSTERSLLIRVDRETIRVDIAAIRYIESLGDYVKIHTGTRVFTTKMRIGELETQLGAAFLRIHRSFLVPVSRITAFSTTKVRLAETSLPIGRTYRSAVQRRLSR
jgi:DNA-binding LytR/AlgR family response regulator